MSEEPETTYLPSGENEAQRTLVSCARMNRVGGGFTGREVLDSLGYAGGGGVAAVFTPSLGGPFLFSSGTSMNRHVLSSANRCRVGYLVQGLT